jgi:hypothetical protein
MERLVVVGMVNPLSTKSEFALWTQPPGCTGHRLWRMATARTGITQRQWLRMTERMNLCTGVWSRPAAVARAEELWESLRNRTVLILGLDTWAAMRRQGDHLTRPLEWMRDRDWAEVPHPSGLSHWYNKPPRRLAVEIILGELAETHRELWGPDDENETSSQRGLSLKGQKSGSTETVC